MKWSTSRDLFGIRLPSSNLKPDRSIAALSGEDIRLSRHPRPRSNLAAGGLVGEDDGRYGEGHFPTVS
jgi:hypothetical protein